MSPFSPFGKIHKTLSLLVIAALLLGLQVSQAQAGREQISSEGFASASGPRTPVQMQTETTAAQSSWSKRFGNHYWLAARSLATDASGNVFMTGAFWYSIDFGSGPLTSAGDEDIFLAKYDASGKPLWSKRFGSTWWDEGNSLATDADGNIYVTGYFFGSVDFGGGPLTGPVSQDIFLAKFDTNGNHLWSKRFGSTGMDEGNSLAIDAAGNVYLTGNFYYAVDFGGGPLGGNAGRYDIFLAKYDSSGNHLWSRSFGSAGDDYGYALATDPSGSVTMTGIIQGSVDFGGGGLVYAGSDDIFLAKYDASGKHLWSKSCGSTGYDAGRSLATDREGNIFLAGVIQGSVDLGGGPLTSAGENDIFLARYDANGNHSWSKRFGSTGDDYAFSIATDPSDTVFVTGRFEDRIDFGGGALTSAGGDDIFLARYAANGNHLWSKRFGNMWHDYGKSLATDAAGHVFMTGQFSGVVDFGSGPLDGGDYRNIFLTRQVLF